MTMQFRTEFPDFDYDLAPLLADLPDAFDVSWHNDACPSAEFDLKPGTVRLEPGTVRVWFDYADATCPNSPRTGRAAPAASTS
jgi:metal-dependent amidase/aminoacylase/carboxypeptidase family protein